jgi:hypothetical protein
MMREPLNAFATTASKSCRRAISSAFSAVWRDAEIVSHVEASEKLHRVKTAFRPSPSNQDRVPTTEADIQQLMVQVWEEH